MLKLASALYNDSGPFDALFNEIKVVRHPNDFNQKFDALVIWGGEDISPSIYKQKVSRLTRAGEHLSLRDRLESELANEAIRLGIPVIGICRGAQLMCAIAGGSLVQHVTGHVGSHACSTKDDKELWINSLHHQMMNLEKVDHDLIAWTNPKRSKMYVGQDDEEIDKCHEDVFKEPEIVWIPSVKALCIQGHPEFASAQNQFINYVLGLTEKLVIPNPIDEKSSTDRC